MTVPDADHRSPTAEYHARLADRRSRIAALDRRHLLFSNARLAVACVGAVLLWMAFIRAALSPLWPLLVWLVFGALAVAHARLLNRMDRAKNAERWYLRGLDRLSGQWPGTGRDGAALLTGHSYGHDLDLFGRASLFELMNTARTGAGESMLADWLRAGSAVGEILARQAAVAELKPMLDFREEVAVLADETSIGRTGPLGAWAASPPAGFPPALGTLLAALAAATAVLAGAVAGEWIGLIWFLAWTCGVAIFQAIWRRRFDRALHAVETPERDLALVCALITRVEAERFGSPRLIALRAAFGAEEALASRRIAQLRRLVSWVDATHNMFAPIAYLLLVNRSWPSDRSMAHQTRRRSRRVARLLPGETRPAADLRLRASVGSLPVDGRRIFIAKRSAIRDRRRRSVRNDVPRRRRRSTRDSRQRIEHVWKRASPRSVGVEHGTGARGYRRESRG